ncbi:hypothetical protein Tco_1053624 [Tanacetum coccineum]|uniref:Uncharacterized protein n=1 Tax=Tanacetum coccineum TaxID=301880 RepID=A0ABQ5GWK8_9ASTR
MAKQQHEAEVHLDELCPPNKRYDLMDANKKFDLEHMQCPLERKILTTIIKNHPLRFNITTSSSVPWIYMAQLWHTLKEDGSEYRLKFMLDKKELSLTLDDFRTIFHLPQANDNNHNSFVPPPSFSDMVPFYKHELGFTMELKTSSSFKTTGLLQPWQTLCKIFSKCLTTRVTGWDQPPLQIMQMMYCFINNIHVDYAELLWEGLYYSLHHPTSSIPGVWARCSSDSSSRLSYLGTHRTPSAPRQSARLTPPVLAPSAKKADEMILQDMIQVSLAEHKSREEQEARENVALVYEHLAVEEIEKLVEDPKNVDDSSPPRHDDTSIPGTRLEPRSDKESPKVEIVQEKEEETTKDTKVEPNKDTPMVDVTNIVIPVNVDDEEDEITDEVFELRRRVKGKNVEETRISPIPSTTRSPRNISILVSSDTEKLQELTVTHPTPSSGSYAQKLTKTNHLLSLIKAKPNQFKRYKSFFFMNYRGLIWLLICTSQEKGSCHDSSDQLADNLHDVRWKRYPRCERENIAIWLALQMKFEKTQVPQTACRSYVVRTREQNDPHDAHPEGENSVKRQKTSEYEAYVSRRVIVLGQFNVEMKNFLQSDIVWESRKEILVSPHPRKITPLVQSCQRDPEAPRTLSLKVKEQARAQHARSSQNLFLFYPAGKSKL